MANQGKAGDLEHCESQIPAKKNGVWEREARQCPPMSKSLGIASLRDGTAPRVRKCRTAEV